MTKEKKALLAVCDILAAQRKMLENIMELDSVEGMGPEIAILHDQVRCMQLVAKEGW